MTTTILADGTLRVDLLKPLTDHGGPVSSIIVREPKGRDFLELGMPTHAMRLPDGSIVGMEMDEVLKAYIERCADFNPALLGQMCLADSMALRDAVLSFFIAARAAISPPSLPSSSSTSDS